MKLVNEFAKSLYYKCNDASPYGDVIVVHD
jgi:hypothetical protein